MRILQVGAGGFGAVWLAALAAEPEASSSRSSTRTPRRWRRAADVPRFTDLDEALAAAGAEIAVVVVPPAAHRRSPSAASRPGCHVLVEKPLAGTREDCVALIEAAARTDRAARGEPELPLPAGDRDGAAGARLGRTRARSGRRRWTSGIHHDFRGSFRERMEQPLILDMAVHSFDLIRFVTGLEAIDVQAHTWNPPWSQFDGDASAMVLFTMDSGARVAYNGSWHPRGQFTDWNCRWLIECERGYLTLDRDVVSVYRGSDVHRPGHGGRGGGRAAGRAGADRSGRGAGRLRRGPARAGGRRATNAADNLRTVEMVLGAVEAATRSRAAISR